MIVKTLPMVRLQLQFTPGVIMMVCICSSGAPGARSWHGDIQRNVEMCHSNDACMIMIAQTGENVCQKKAIFKQVPLTLVPLLHCIVTVSSTDSKLRQGPH